MRDPLRVRRADRARERDRVRQEPIECQTALRDQLAERAALDQLHGQERNVVELLDGMDGDDAGVVQRCERPGFTLETFPALRASGEIRREHLQGDPTLEPQVLPAYTSPMPPLPSAATMR